MSIPDAAAKDYERLTGALERTKQIHDRPRFGNLWAASLALLGLWLLQGATPASGQELLWSKLPEDGAWVRFYGTYKDLQERPESNEGPLELSWLTELTIKSVGKETVQIGTTTVPCRWIEFKKVIGYQSAEGIKPGPYGVRIYKVLIPEAKVTGKLQDEAHIPVTFIPIIKGFRRIGEQNAIPITEKVLSTYPNVTLLAHYDNLSPVGSGDETIDLPQLGSVTTRHSKGTATVLTETARSLNEGEVWTSPEMPFGLAKYHVKLVREEKEDTETDVDFKKVAEVEVEMTAVEKGTDAQSEIEGAISAATGDGKPGQELPGASSDGEMTEELEAPAEEMPAEDDGAAAEQEAEMSEDEAPADNE